MLLAPANRRLDATQGETIRWIRSYGKCPCYNPANGSHNLQHTLCGGTGSLHVEVDASPYLAIITAARSGRDYGPQLGQVQTGDIVCSTWQNEIPLSEGDLVIVPSRVAQINIPLAASGTSQDSIQFNYVNGISVVYDQNGAVSPSVYSFSAGYPARTSFINWTATPAAGTRYSLHLTYVPVWRVFEGSVLLRKPDLDGSPLPQRVLLRLVAENKFD